MTFFPENHHWVSGEERGQIPAIQADKLTGVRSTPRIKADRAFETHAQLRISVQEVRPPFRENPEILRRHVEEMPGVRRQNRAGDFRAGGAIQRLGLVRDRLREEILGVGFRLRFRS